MPKNKNAMIRYKILDELLNDQYHEYSINDLTQKVNDYLFDLSPQSDGVGIRTIQKDLNDLKTIFLVDIKEWWVSYYNKELRKTTQKKCFRYADPSFSIFKKELTDDEKFLIREAISLLGKFEGLPNFEGLNNLKSTLGIDGAYNAIVSFDKNPQDPNTFFGELFTAISQKHVIKIGYHKYSEEKNSSKYLLHPYLLKEYNRRWYILASDINDNLKLKNFALDRIDNISPQPAIEYIEYDGNINDRFEDIVGVTFFENNPVEDILIWVSDNSKNYILDKPIHKSHTHIKTPESVEKYREQYPHLNGGVFITLECKENYELLRELASYGQDLLVLKPQGIQDKIISRIQEMNKAYDKLRK